MSLETHFIVIFFTCNLGDVISEVITSDASATLRSTPWKPCKIPDHRDYHYLTMEEEKLDPAKSYDGSGKFTARVSCISAKKIVKPDSFAVCFDGKWYPSQHTCVTVTKCPPMYDTYSTHYKCTTADGYGFNCSLPSLPGFKLTIHCAHRGYRFSDDTMQRETVCQENGKWEKLEKCIVRCGQVFNNPSINSNDPRLRLYTENPWHAVVYIEKNDGVWNQLCVGTMITNFIILTSNNCYQGDWGGGNIYLRVAVRKYHKLYLGDEMYNYVNLTYYVKHYHHLKLLTSRVALLSVHRYIEFSDTVGCACLYKKNNPDVNYWKHVGGEGRIVVWGKDDNNNDVAVAKKVQYVSRDKCQTSEAIDHLEFCSISNNNHTFNRGDIGAGLVVLQKSTGVFYLKGVLNRLSSDGKIAFFTDVSTGRHLDYIADKIKQINRNITDTNPFWYRRRMP